MGQRVHWSGRLAFILAAAGSAIGLGNIWKFPYIAGVNGGGAFVLIYLLCIACVGLPVLISEIYIGQRTQSNAVRAFEKLSGDKKTFWSAPGYMGLISAILILSFYSVVGGWVLDFFYQSVSFQFQGKSAAEISDILGGMLGDPVRMSISHTLFMGLTVAMVYGGIKDGLERWTKILMPALLVLLVAMLAKSVSLDGFSAAISFLFSPDFSKLSPAGILEAVGHSFFTLSLGMGAMLTYGSYLNEKEDLLKTGLMIAFLDTFIALLAGVVIFSIVFSFDLEPASGPGLMFATLPGLLAQMPGGDYLSIIFFMLVLFAALSSAVSILEVAITYFSETLNKDRKKVTLGAGLVIYLMAYLPLFSFNYWKEVKVFGLNFFDLFDSTSSHYLLPIGGLMISLFMGWRLGLDDSMRVTSGNKPLALGLMWLTRVVAPIAIAVVIYQKVVA